MRRLSMITDANISAGDTAAVAAPAPAELTPEQATQQTLETVTDPEVVKQSISKLLDYDLATLLNTIVDGCISIAMKLVVALLIYYVGRWIIGRTIKVMNKMYDRRNIELSVRSFLNGVIKVLLYVLVVLIIIQVLGINTTSLVAMLASAGLAIGMALSGTLQNFAGGVMIIFLRPYRIGDYIDALGEEGTVKKIGLFSTEIITVDNRSIFIPNSTISSSVIDNYSMADMRRVDWNINIEYGTDVESVRAILLEIMRSDKRIVSDPEPVVFLTDITDSAIKFSARGWVKNSDYWSVKFDVNERIYTELPKKGISFPFPKLDITIKNNNN